MSAHEHPPLPAEANRLPVQEVGSLIAPIETVGPDFASNGAVVVGGLGADAVIARQEERDDEAVRDEQHKYVISNIEALKVEVEDRMAQHPDVVGPDAREMLLNGIRVQVVREAYERRRALIQEHGGGEEGVAKLHQAEAERAKAEEARVIQERADFARRVKGFGQMGEDARGGNRALQAYEESLERAALAPTAQEPEPARPDYVSQRAWMLMGDKRRRAEADALIAEQGTLVAVAVLERQYGANAAAGLIEYRALVAHLEKLNAGPPDRTLQEREALWRTRIDAINASSSSSHPAAAGNGSAPRHAAYEKIVSSGLPKLGSGNNGGTQKVVDAGQIIRGLNGREFEIQPDGRLLGITPAAASANLNTDGNGASAWGAPLRWARAIMQRRTVGNPNTVPTSERRQKIGRRAVAVALGALAVAGIGAAIANGESEPGTEGADHSAATIAPPPALSSSPERPAGSVADQVAEQLQPIGKYNRAAKEGTIGQWGKVYAAKHGYATNDLTPKQARSFVGAMKDELLNANHRTEASARMVQSDFTPIPLSVNRIRELHDIAKAS